MRKATPLLLAVIVALAAVAAGVGYGKRFAEQAVHVGTVSTGSGEVVFTQHRLTADRHIFGDAQLLNPTTLAVSISGLYPSWRSAASYGRVRLHLTATNVGSVPVRFDSAVFDIAPSPLVDYLRSSCWLVYDEDGPGPKPTVSWGYLQIPWGRFDQLDDALNSSAKLKSLVLDPGGWISFDTTDENSIVIRLDESAPNGTENQTLNFTLSLNFKQWNAP